MVVARRSSSSAAILALVVANLLPLAGVVWWGWTVLEVLVLYWIESGIVGLLNVPKILLARGGVDEVGGTNEVDGTDGANTATATTTSTTRLHVQGVPQEWFTDESGAAHNAGLALFFVFHYGVFWVVHGVFVFALPLFALGSSFGGGAFGASGAFGGGSPVGGTPFGGFQSVWGFGTSLSVFALAVASMALSHGVSFAVNYLGHGEYRTVTPDAQMMRPYGRVMVLHMTVLFGAWLVASLGSPLPVLALLVGLKTAFDLGAHLRDHRRYESAPGVS